MATSPPHPPNLTLNPPRKRPSINTTTDDPSKRRKPSTFSTTSSNHPLRQTSFPPPEHQGFLASPSYSPSRRTSFSPAASSIADGSTTAPTGRGGGKRGGRGGRRKGNADGRSITGTSAANSIVGSTTGTNAGKGGGDRASKAPSAAGTATRGGGGQRGNAQEEDGGEDDEEDEGNALDTILEGGGERTSAQAKLEREHMRMLLESFTPEQSERYDMWRRVKLPKAAVRRLVNQALSQSVGPGIMTVVGGYMKVFVGELVERAREVQGEWCASRERLATGEGNEVWEGLMEKRPYYAPLELGDEAGAEVDGEGEKVDGEQKQTTQMKKPQLEVKEMDKGPLTPDHLREALRRYKRDREGGGVGYQGISQYGRANTAVRTGGRRLFK